MYTHLEDYVMNLYKTLNVSTPNQLDMFAIAKMIGVDIVYRETIFRLGNEVILQNNNLSEQWMDFGHELAHVLLHSGIQLNMYPMYREYQEWRADLFALHFCVPTFMLEQLNLPSTRNEAIGLIAKEFCVSFEFAEVRLGKWLNKNNLLDTKTLIANY